VLELELGVSAVMCRGAGGDVETGSSTPAPGVRAPLFPECCCSGRASSTVGQRGRSVRRAPRRADPGAARRDLCSGTASAMNSTTGRCGAPCCVSSPWPPDGTSYGGAHPRGGSDRVLL
jgi:hypothetical protein